MPKKYCINCGKEIPPERDVCVECIERSIKNGKEQTEHN